MFSKSSFLKSLLVTLGLIGVACGGGSSDSVSNSSLDEVNITFSNALVPNSIQELDESRLVYSIEAGEETEYGCLTDEDGLTSCPVSVSDLDNELLFTVQYLQDDEGAVAPAALVSAAKLPVFNPDQGKSAAGKKPYVIGQAVVKISADKVKEIKTGKTSVIDLIKGQVDGGISLFDFNDHKDLVDRFREASVCGNNSVDTGEQCDGGENCDSECTREINEGVIEEGIKFTEGYILPQGAVADQIDVFPFAVEPGHLNFIQASARTVAGDSRAPTNVRLYQNYGTDDEALLVESSGIQSLIEYGSLSEGNYAIVVRKKANARNQNIEASQISYTLETIFGSSVFDQGFYQNQREFFALDQKKYYDFFFRVSDDDIINLTLDERSIQPRKINLYTGENSQSYNVMDVIPRLTKIRRNGVYGKIANSVTIQRRLVRSDATVGAIYRNERRSIYTLGVGENFGDGPELDVGEYIVSLDTYDRYDSVNPQEEEIVRLSATIEENVRAGVCGNDVIERNETCDGSNCSVECTKVAGAARLNLDTTFIRNSFEEGDGRGNIRIFGSPEEKLIFSYAEVGERDSNCATIDAIVDHQLLRLPTSSFSYNIDDDLLELGALRDAPIPLGDFCSNISFPTTFSDQLDLGDIQFLDLTMRQVNAEVDQEFYVEAKVTRYREIDLDRPSFYKSAFGGNLFASKVYFVVPENNLPMNTTSFMAVVRDANTKACVGGVTLKSRSYHEDFSLLNTIHYREGDTLLQKEEFSDGECASVIFENPGSNMFFEVSKYSPSLNGQDQFVLDIVPVKAKTGDDVRSLDFASISEFDNVTESDIANVNEVIAPGETLAINFRILQGQYLSYNFPNRINGMYYRLVVKSGQLLSQGHKVFLSGPAEFESVPVLTSGEYALEVYNTTDSPVRDFQIRMERTYDILPGIYTVLKTNAKMYFHLSASRHNGGRLVDFQLTDESGDAGAGDCDNPNLTIRHENTDVTNIQANTCGSASLSMFGIPERFDLIINDENYISDLTNEDRYFYFTLQINQQ